MSPTILILCALIILAGAGMLGYALYQRKRISDSANWPSVAGRALSFEVRRHVSTNSKTHRRTVSYRPAVSYEYTVDGVGYQSKRVSFGDLRKGSEEEVRRSLEPALQGGALRVFYNPQKASDAVLLNTEASGVTSNLVIGVVLLAMGVILTVLFAMQ